MTDRKREYQEQAIKNASPTELITKLYDFAIQACHSKDEERLQDVLQTLVKSLNFDFEVSASLYNLYEYCQRQAQEEQFDEVSGLLAPLRETWIDKVVNTNEKAAAAGGKGFVV
jgi:flagellin-specific chaperone FliS